jgi:hypothetical protein
MNSQDGNALYLEESCFSPGFSFVLSALAVDTHAAYENLPATWIRLQT